MKKYLILGLLFSVPCIAQENNVTNRTLSGPTSNMLISMKPSALVIAGEIIRINPNGTVKIKEGVSLDDASKLFWERIQEMGMKLACEKKELEK